MKRTLLILTYFIMSFFLITNRQNEIIKPVNSEISRDEYSQNYYELTLKNTNLKTFLFQIQNLEIKIIEITPKPFKNLNISFLAKGNTNSEIYENFISDYTTFLTKKGYTEEALHIKELGVNVEKIKVLGIEKDIKYLKNELEIEYIIINQT